MEDMLDAMENGQAMPIKATLVFTAGSPEVIEACAIAVQPVPAKHHGTAQPSIVITDTTKQPQEFSLRIGCPPIFPPDGSLILQLENMERKKCTALLSSVEPGAINKLRSALAQFGASTDTSSATATANSFDVKTEAASSHMYFHYYGMLQHQQNMLQDATRTGTYYWSIMNNSPDFKGAVVVDVGAGSGILSLFAAQAGARKVYAIEASNIVRYAQKLFDANGEIGSRITILHGKLETLALPEKADVLISEPMGTLLVNERMLETYIYARRHMLKPGGKMFPGVGRIFVAAFSDAALFQEQHTMAAFWQNESFYGVNLTSLHPDAVEGYCGKVVVDAFDPGILISTWAHHSIDFNTAEEDDLADICIPLELTCKGPQTLHGVACWFDVLFDGSVQPMWLSTAPGMPITHWFQLRCVFKTPIEVRTDGELVRGEMRLKAHNAQSYDVHVTLEAPGAPGGGEPQKSSGVFDLKDPYYRQLRNAW